MYKTEVQSFTDFRTLQLLRQHNFVNLTHAVHGADSPRTVLDFWPLQKLGQRDLHLTCISHFIDVSIWYNMRQIKYCDMKLRGKISDVESCNAMDALEIIAFVSWSIEAKYSKFPV